MSAEIISFDSARASRYLERAMMAFIDDPADSDHQRGFLSALIVVYQEGLGYGYDDGRIALLKARL